MTLPISVVIPHRRSRDAFFRRYCLPSIEANNPAQIIVRENDGNRGQTAAIERNAGARSATQPFLFFCDDDCVLASDCLGTLLDKLDSAASFAYCDYLAVVFPESSHPIKGAWIQRGQPWNPRTIVERNYISTMTLKRHATWIPFDESLAMFGDWDISLTYAERGHVGTYVSEVLFHAYFMDAGLSKGGIAEARGRDAVLAKHRALIGVRHLP